MRAPLLVLITLALVGLAGCGSDPVAEAADAAAARSSEENSDAVIAEGMNLEAEIVGHVWSLTSLDGSDPAEGASSTMLLEEDGKISGQGGCNRYFGTYTLEDDALEIGPLASTKMACPPPLMEHEDRFLEVLGKTRFLRLEGSQLTLTGDAGELVFLLLDEDVPAGDELPSEPV